MDRIILMGILILGLARKASSLQCYMCDNNRAPACGPNFKAYQFDAMSCAEEEGVTYKCGKQVQPPLEDGWVGVIRSCYSTGALPGLNATNGCQYYHVEKENFTALYCFCDTDNCNSSSSLGTFTTIIVTVILYFSVFFFPS